MDILNRKRWKAQMTPLHDINLTSQSEKMHRGITKVAN